MGTGGAGLVRRFSLWFPRILIIIRCFSFVFFMSSETSLKNIQHDLSFWSENDDGFVIRGYSVGMHRYILIWFIKKNGTLKQSYIGLMVLARYWTQTAASLSNACAHISTYKFMQHAKRAIHWSPVIGSCFGVDN